MEHKRSSGQVAGYGLLYKAFGLVCGTWAARERDERTTEIQSLRSCCYGRQKKHELPDKWTSCEMKWTKPFFQLKWRNIYKETLSFVVF